ncbi:MAG TPA: biotin/lipoyl-containing protein [Gaiellales bacterium]
MARLVDTSIRLLSQEPFVGRISTARILRLAEDLDSAGYAALEVTGGGCFSGAVSRAVESPWERIRALKARTTTPLVMALRGTFLVGPRPADADLVRRFILCAAESGIEIFRLHDPLNDVDDLVGPISAVREAGAVVYAGLVYSEAPGGGGLVERARRLGELGVDRVLLHDPAGALDPAGAGRLISQMGEAAGVPVGLYVQGSGGTALAVAIEAARAGADPIATASYPVAMLTQRPAAELLTQALRGLSLDAGLDREIGWEVARRIESEIGDAAAVAPPVSPQVALRAALATVPAGLVAAVERRLAAVGAADRLDEVLDEVRRVREECGSPPPAPPVGLILATQAIQHVLGARRWVEVDEEMRRLLLGEYGHPPGPIDETARAVAEATVAEDAEDLSLDHAREVAGTLATSEEELCLVALFGERALPLLESLRGRHRRLTGDEGGPDASEGERVQRLIGMLEESDLSELSLEDGDVRITLRKADQRPLTIAGPAIAQPAGPAAPAEDETDSSVIRVEAPMVGVFYRSASPSSPPFVEEGARVEVGQTLCILEAMKLFNELKSDHAGIVKRIAVRNADPVEYGQLLFELV